MIVIMSNNTLRERIQIFLSNKKLSIEIFLVCIRRRLKKNTFRRAWISGPIKHEEITKTTIIRNKASQTSVKTRITIRVKNQFIMNKKR